MSEVVLSPTTTRIARDIREAAPSGDLLDAMHRFRDPEITRAGARREVAHITAAALEAFRGFFGAAPLLVPILRAGMAMWPAADAHFGQPHSSFVVARKTKGTGQVDLSFSSGLDSVTGSGILMLDTVSATGDTVVSVAQALRRRHPHAPINALICYASPEAIAAIEACQALTRLGIAVRSEGVDPQGWLLPRIGGDAGDKLYGVPQ